MSRKNIYLLIATAVIIGAGIFYAIGRQAESIPPDGSITPTGVIRNFELVAKRFEFQPRELVVDRGDKVAITLKSTDTRHGFAIAEYGIDEKSEPGKDKTFEFIADRPGEFVFFCSVFCGAGHDEMIGRFIVR